MQPIRICAKRRAEIPGRFRSFCTGGRWPPSRRRHFVADESHLVGVRAGKSCRLPSRSSASRAATVRAAQADFSSRRLAACANHAATEYESPSFSATSYAKAGPGCNLENNTSARFGPAP